MNLKNWPHGNKLSLNVAKTQSLIIGSRSTIQKIEKQTEAKPSFEIGDQKINMMTDTKYLGVQIDEKLQWDQKINMITDRKYLGVQIDDKLQWDQKMNMITDTKYLGVQIDDKLQWDQKINMITDTKYLGVQIDDKLQWDQKINMITDTKYLGVQIDDKLQWDQKMNMITDTKYLGVQIDDKLQWDQKINMITDTKYLGVQIDDKHKWGRYIEQFKAKALGALGLIKHAKKFLPSGDLQKIYRGIVEPHFSYCCSVWGCCSETKVNSFQSIPNRAARITTNSPYDASAALCYKIWAGLQLKILSKKKQQC